MGILNVTPDSFSDAGRFFEARRRPGPRPGNGRRRRRHHRRRRRKHPPRRGAQSALDEEIDRVLPMIEKIKEETGRPGLDRHHQGGGGPPGRGRGRRRHGQRHLGLQLQRAHGRDRGRAERAGGADAHQGHAGEHAAGPFLRRRRRRDQRLFPGAHRLRPEPRHQEGKDHPRPRHRLRQAAGGQHRHHPKPEGASPSSNCPCWSACRASHSSACWAARRSPKSAAPRPSPPTWSPPATAPPSCASTTWRPTVRALKVWHGLAEFDHANSATNARAWRRHETDDAGYLLADRNPGLRAAAAAAPAADLAALFPELDGWSRDGTTELFLPDTLYEHINGAAENFLAYGFEQLAVQNYVNAEQRRSPPRSISTARRRTPSASTVPKSRWPATISPSAARAMPRKGC